MTATSRAYAANYHTANYIAGMQAMAPSARAHSRTFWEVTTVPVSNLRSEMAGASGIALTTTASEATH